MATMLRGIGHFKMPKYLYRYLQHEEYAKAFVAGEIWLSTFDHIRNCDATRADAHDGTSEYTAEWRGTGDPTSEAVIQRRLAQGGIRFKGGLAGHVVTANVMHSRHRSAYVLCTTSIGNNAKMRSQFGQFCVQIHEPGAFMVSLVAAIELVVPWQHYVAGAVQYEGRKFANADESPGALGFASVPSLKHEREFRLIYQPENQDDIKPIAVTVPAARSLCELI
ncbi:MAG: hypothetical protein ACJ8G1_25150 [Vitreoscilla sp.]